MNYLIAYGVFLMAIMSPGPDVAATLQNAIISRRHGIACAVGIGIGNAVHITLASTVLGVFLARYPAAFTAMQVFAAAYLLYLACKSFFAPASELTPDGSVASGISEWTSLRQGVLICLSNPKAVMFWLSFFSATVAGLGSGRNLFIVALVVTLIAWFSCVAVFFSIDRIRQKFLAFESAINKAVAILYAVIGLGLLASVGSELLA